MIYGGIQFLTSSSKGNHRNKYGPLRSTDFWLMPEDRCFHRSRSNWLRTCAKRLFWRLLLNPPSLGYISIIVACPNDTEFIAYSCYFYDQLIEYPETASKIQSMLRLLIYQRLFNISPYRTIFNDSKERINLLYLFESEVNVQMTKFSI